MQMEHNFYSVYRYIIIGQQEVGKTNLITRFIKDQFIQARNLKLEGEQSAIFIINNCKFKIVFKDSINSTSLKSFENQGGVQTIDGIIFLFSLDKEETLNSIEEEINYFHNTFQPALFAKGKRLTSILVGNKSDLLQSTLDLTNLLQKEKDNEKKKSMSDKARYYDEQFGIRYFQISTKCSTKQDIEALFVELINKNEIFKFMKTESREGVGSWSKYLPKMPCADENAICIIY